MPVPSAFVRRIRRIVRTVAALGVLACVVGFFPGERVYDDSNNCFGQAFGDAFAMHHGAHHGGGCTSHYDKLVATRPAGGLPLVLFVALVVGYGALLAVRPRRWLAVVWTPWTLGALAAWFALTFELDLFSHVTHTWASSAVVALAGAMLLLVFPVTPLVAFLSSREPPPDGPPAARIVRAPSSV